MTNYNENTEKCYFCKVETNGNTSILMGAALHSVHSECLNIVIESATINAQWISDAVVAYIASYPQTVTENVFVVTTVDHVSHQFNVQNINGLKFRINPEFVTVWTEYRYVDVSLPIEEVEVGFCLDAKYINNVLTAFSLFIHDYDYDMIDFEEI